METIKKNSKSLITIAVIIAVILLYRSFFSDGTEIVVDPKSQNIGSDVVALNESLQSVTLNPEIFSAPGYKALIDFSAPLPDQPLGRPNPFDPI